jgi:hypothetical protein
MQQALEHAVEVVVAVGQLLAGESASDGVAEQKHSHLDLVTFALSGREPQRVVGALAAVGLVVDHDQDIHRRRVPCPGRRHIKVKRAPACVKRRRRTSSGSEMRPAATV